MERIALVSNRLPALKSGQPRAGGLAIGLGAAMQVYGGTWLGWDGTVSDSPSQRLRIRQADGYAQAALSLCEAEHRDYYLGFANRTLWPLLHGRIDLLRFQPSELAAYRAVNERFARHVADIADGFDLLWVHDYHFLLLGQALRRLGIDLPSGFFLHVPFPPPDMLAALPCHVDVLEALSAYDLVGFQTEVDADNFRRAVAQYLDGVVYGDGRFSVQGRDVRVGAFPIGIDTGRFESLAASKEVTRLGDRLSGHFATQLGVIGVDRLDYTKGLVERLRAFERLLEIVPRYRRRAFLLQVAAPSRETVPEYVALKRELEAHSGRINGRYGEIDWTPVRYLNRTFSHTRLAAFYRLSRVGLVTPLRDGMNLVAKEYVAAQCPESPGVLVLSRFAGAAERLSGAVLVNPYDIDAIAAALRQALNMPLDERRERWSASIAELRQHDVHDWYRGFLRALRTTRRDAAETRPFITPAIGYGSLRSRPPRPVRHPGPPRPASSEAARPGVADRWRTVGVSESSA